MAGPAPVQHVVLFRWKPDADPGAVERVMAALRGFAGSIPGVESAAAGANFSDRARGYTHGAVMRLAGRAALDALVPHPAHRAMRAQLPPILDEILVFDFEAGAEPDADRTTT